MPTPRSAQVRRRRPTLPTIDREVLDLGVRWADFGGAGAEDIFVLFGWSERQYFERLQTLAERHVTTNLRLRARLLEVCEERLKTVGSSRR
ncbi:MAG TPA: DUF3263 domain-containing protein [Mycobacterium sp.]